MANKKKRTEIPAPMFREHDICGRYPEAFTDEIVAEIVAALVDVLADENRRAKIIVGHDPGERDTAMHESIKKQLSKEPLIEVLDAGGISIAMLYFLIDRERASGGIIIMPEHGVPQHKSVRAMRSGGEVISGTDISKRIKKK
jgi:phosphomannomutase